MPAASELSGQACAGGELYYVLADLDGQTAQDPYRHGQKGEMMWIDAKALKPQPTTNVLVALVADNPRKGLEGPMAVVGWIEPDGSWTALLPGVVLPNAPVQFWQDLPDLPDAMVSGEYA